MKSDGNWYVRNVSGKVFGPIDFKTLQEWVRDGRVEPLAGISQDLQNWMLAPLKPELEMDWIVENNPGQFYGPTHKAVVDDFVSSGTLSAGARFYCDDHGKAAAAMEELRAELESARSAQEAESAKALNAVKALKGLNAELESAKAELEATKAELEATKAELESIKAELESVKAEKESVHAREWKTEVLVPEVVVNNEPPPPTARTVFGCNSSSLAELERQAQAELVRMGASGAKKFFGFGKKK